MQSIDDILDRLEDILIREKDLIVKSINDTNLAEHLLKISEEKRDLLSKLSNFTKEEALTRIEKIKKLNGLIDTNRELIINNLKFIDELFEAVFETTKTYSPEGSIKGSSEGFINKKV